MESKHLSTSEATAFGRKDPQSVDNRNKNHTKCINMSWDIGSLYSPFLVCCCLDPFFVCRFFFLRDRRIKSLANFEKQGSWRHKRMEFHIIYNIHAFPRSKALKILNNWKFSPGNASEKSPLTIHHPSPCLVVGRFTGRLSWCNRFTKGALSISTQHA